MDRNLLKKALLRGIPLGLGLALLAVLLEWLLHGGTFFGILFSLSGFLRMIVFSGAWIWFIYRKGKK